uniref:CCHC-type domain-containing protein n=1 Tax=Heligmosomoides polygyrus TaxID=6339 RepID=A0A183FAA1_HELPZ
LFSSIVHEQDLPVLRKFAYLLSTLTGEAKEVLGGFQFREENYEVAVQWLKKKYSREEVAIEQLYRKVEEAYAKDATTAAQRKLLDDLSATMMQLTTKGQNVNHRKGASKARKAAVIKRVELEQIPRTLEEIISKQEYIERSRQAINKEENPTRRKTNHKKEGPSNMPGKKECIYCHRTNHESYQCRTVPFEERLLFLTRNKLCHNCGKLNHFAKECKGPSCFKCGKKHHPSTCKGRQQQGETRRHMDNGSKPQPSAINGRPRSPQARETTRARRENRPRTHPNRAMVNEIEEDERSEEESDPEEREEVCHVTGSHEGKKRTTLLTGMAKILGEEKDIDVPILLDTGSELSFIDTQLIKDLNLPVVGKSQLKIRTFGQTTVEEIQYPVTQVLLEDKLGKIHELRLYGSKTIASKVKRPILSEDDWLFIRERGLDLTEEEVEESQPRILLGCDLLWDFVNGLKVKLASGIYAISTLFGYMLSGSQSSQNSSTKEQVMCTSNLSEEAELWDTYWKMDSVGINEYPGPEKTEKQRCDEEVWRNFCDTTVKRSDGYYVRLPWKQQHEPLPDNYKIALARLRGTYNRYRGDSTMMEKYDEVFKDQVQKGILEEVSPEEMQTKNTVHYLSHQAVLTPSKTTTKIRIVFDASAHYSGKPSLNDVLHQGPLILPKLFSMMLRFRTGSIAIISDVEKAFLQVRLHKADKDATRCLWLRDIHRPPEGNNVVVYRFTRVTFGLNASPFLLSATIRFHLESEENTSLAKEINTNLYVDNLFLTAETVEEGLHKYKNSKGFSAS